VRETVESALQLDVQAKRLAAFYARTMGVHSRWCVWAAPSFGAGQTRQGLLVAHVVVWLYPATRTRAEGTRAPDGSPWA